MSVRPWRFANGILVLTLSAIMLLAVLACPPPQPSHQQTTISLNVILGVGSPSTPVNPFCAQGTGSGPKTLDSGKLLEQGLVSDPNGNITVNFFGGVNILPAGLWQWSYLEGQATMSNGVYSCPSSTPMNNLGGCARQVIANQSNVVTMTKTANGMICQ
jgi:hypothetical protein